ncbi:uncharacterized protein LOC111694165 [Trichogramma pretiosum]|uniref:uncharacterized protein LOC111694165 n=1 Tax=Trichogramma pretiosum TaxID=7493 RepID=UPI000C71BB02|nr:uncharacterized protein LOC111694165 [Trichogramma pretiosum]
MAFDDIDSDKKRLAFLTKKGYYLTPTKHRLDNRLQEGIELSISQERVQIFFKLGLIVGDNLGLHGILGFTESFNANYACRFCKMNKFQRSIAIQEDEAYLRTKENYERDVNVHDVSKTGIKESCVFENLPGFHVLDNISADIMHDLMEGICMFDLCSLIKYYIEKKFFTLDDLNLRIARHDWGIVDCNKPTPIFQKDLLNDVIRMSASELFQFTTHFGILIGDYIPINDPAWNVYIVLRKIVALATCPALQRGCSTLLKNLIKEHHSLVIQILKRPLKPKDHIAVHLFSVMRETGPLVNTWGMRFEAKHQESKVAANSIHSKKLVCDSIVKKHQLKLACILYKQEISSKFQNGPSQEISFEEFKSSVQEKLPQKNDLFNEKVKIFNWIEKYGSKYQPGVVVCVAEQNGQPVFGKIKSVCERGITAIPRFSAVDDVTSKTLAYDNCVLLFINA